MIGTAVILVNSFSVPLRQGNRKIEGMKRTESAVCIIMNHMRESALLSHTTSGRCTTMTVKDLQQGIADNMKRWQKIEDASIASTGRIIEKTDNPIIRLTMEIIQRDSQMHYLVQEWIADSLEKKAVALTPDELNVIWDLVERHISLEKRMMEIVEQTLGSLKGKRMVVQEYLLSYLLEDETKHNNLLAKLETIKKGMLP
jgi:hypothetical protein